jgi:hypothetical protein
MICFFCGHGEGLAALKDVFPHVLKYGIPERSHEWLVCADTSACQNRQLDALASHLPLMPVAPPEPVRWSYVVLVIERPTSVAALSSWCAGAA